MMKAAQAASITQRALQGVPQPVCPVTLICGPEGAGKFRYILDHHQGDDLILIPWMTSRVLHLPFPFAPEGRGASGKIFAYEMDRLAKYKGRHVWLVRNAPHADTRAAWLDALGPKARLVLLTPAQSTCRRRILADHRPYKDQRLVSVHHWFRIYNETKGAAGDP